MLWDTSLFPTKQVLIVLNKQLLVLTIVYYEAIKSQHIKRTVPEKNVSGITDWKPI